MPERRTLAQVWVEFMLQCIPEAAPPRQVTEMKRAYYAGAAAIFGILTDDLDPDHEPTPGDVAFVESIYQEMVQFTKDIDKGIA